MRKIKFNLILIILIPFFLYSCASAKNALQGQKRSEQSDEFLVEKKNPLVLPPEYGKLPAPQDGQIKSDEIKNEENKIFVNNEINDLPSTVEVDSKPSSIEKSILKQID